MANVRFGSKADIWTVSCETQFTSNPDFVAGDGTSALTQIAVERANDGVIIVTGDRLN